MKKQSLFSLLVLFFAFVAVSCDDEDEDQVLEVDTSIPTGDFTVARSGTLTAENETPTAGTVELGTDTDGENFLRLADDFMTETATGTVTVYLSTSDMYMADPMNGNPDLQLIGALQENGERFFKLDAAPDDKFTHVILWCATAGIPFGNAALQ